MEFYQSPIISAPRIIRDGGVVTKNRSSSLASQYTYHSPTPYHHHHHPPPLSHHQYSYTTSSSSSPSSTLFSHPSSSPSSSYPYSSPISVQYTHPHVGSRRTSITSPASNYTPHGSRSRSSIDYNIADVSRDGGLFTRRLSQSSSSGFQSSNTRSGISSLGRSMSIEPSSSVYYSPSPSSSIGYGGGYRSSYVQSQTTPSLRNRSSISTTGSHYHQQQPTSCRSSFSYYTAIPPTTPATPSHYDHHYQPLTATSPLASVGRITRRDSFSKPYYTLNDEHSGDLVVKRTSIYQPLTFCNLPLTYLRRDSVVQQQQQQQEMQQQHPVPIRYGSQIRDSFADGGRVVASSNVVSRRTSIGREPSVEASLASRRASVRRSLTPASNQIYQQQQQQPQQQQQRQRTSFYQNIAPLESEGRKPSIINVRTSITSVGGVGGGSRPGSLANSGGFLRDSNAGLANINRTSVVVNDSMSTGGGGGSNVGKTYYDYRSGYRKEPTHSDVDAAVWKGRNSFEKPVQNDEFSLVHQLGSLSDLRKRTSEAKDQLGKHRILIDRYLPIKMGPEPEVAFEIQNKYGELVERLPYIERRGRYVKTSTTNETNYTGDREAKKEDDDEQTKSRIKPYKPATNVKSNISSLFNVYIPNSFTPVVSETRKRARNVLCKVKGDPSYYNFN